MNSNYKIIKLTTPWKSKFLYNTIDNPNLYLSQTPGGNGIYGDYKFEVNNDISECDYWFIYGGLTLGELKQKVKCPIENIFYITDEVHCNRFYVKKFLDQFPNVVTCRTDIHHRNVINYHELLIWYLHKSYDEIANTTTIEKTKKLCIINSNLVETPLQRTRYELTHKLIGHFKDKIDVFGRGHQTFTDKWDILKNYKYSVAIENTVQYGYFTEKIAECFLTHTYPLYYGCPNIADYFDTRAFTTIDVNDYKTCIRQIEEVIEEDLYEEKAATIQEQKYKYLNQYHLFPGIINLIQLHGNSNTVAKWKTIYTEEYFKRLYWMKRFIQVINNRKISEKYKFNINLYVDGDYANK
ncbi:glycosyltransferase family 10 domain-containing protein [Paradesertivirga mongoliensis]|uniref:Glycosyltransferase family 10 domain-containing protein n=1 Tax=Paradesertivirga mongoliensis TaxID=2100740 RepID=A0ABW4ZGM1_9SPHI|nr:glycosyltransferase family 10 [Pedobacter mongoliensis]